jgi:Uma2 family endonuclease
MSVEVFLVWDSADGRRYELVDGEPRAMAPANMIHGLLQGRLFRLIETSLLQRGSHCLVFVNPGVVPRVMSAHNFRVPDIGVTCAPLQPGQVMMTDPVLLAEVLSPSNRADTWSNVWSYTGIPGLQEILVLHTSRVMVELLRRDSDGQWPEEPARYEKGDVDLTSIGFMLNLVELYLGTGLA